MKFKQRLKKDGSEIVTNCRGVKICKESVFQQRTNYPQPFKKVVPDLDDIKKMESEDDGKEKIEKNISNQNSNGALSQISDQPQKKKRKRNRKKKNSSMTSPQTNGNNIENKSVTVQPKKMQPDDIVKFD